MSKNNGTQAMVEFEDWSERPQPGREDLRKEVARLTVLVDGYRQEYREAKRKLATLHDSELAERRRADLAEHESFQLYRRLERIPSRIRSFFDWIHKVQRAWRYVTSQA